MYAYRYPAEFTPAAEGGFVVTFPDIPEAITQGETVEECIEDATDALDEAITGRINAKLEIPKASLAQPGQYLISVPMQTALKAALYEEVSKLGWSKVGMATQLGIDEREVRRLLDPYHPTKLPRIAEILQRVGVRTTVVAELESELLVQK
jgi:antitoxin HicB